MISRRRVSRVYVKELVDILRDRRTLLAMVVVPIVLYPLLMLGAVQAISVAEEELGRRTIVVAVRAGEDQRLLPMVLERDAESSGQPERDSDRETRPPEPTSSGKPPEGGADSTGEAARPEVKLVLIDEDDMDDAIRSRAVQVCVVFRDVEKSGALTDQWRIELRYDPDEPKSRFAADWIAGVFGRMSETFVKARAESVGLPEKALTPILLEHRTITTPGSVLGQILPVILVLMTITGAIYPAIDLTAGERERGTLETLMVCPVPVIELIVGKFLVVATVAIVGAALNLASVSATVYLGGFEQALSGTMESHGFPIGVLLLILLSLVPFAVLFSAIMIAVCSFARTFKEAQNYVTPVILATLVPAGLAALPTAELRGGMLVMPVSNMVLLARELLLGSPVPFSAFAWVIASTTLYAAAAVALAARVYGSESVAFSDSGSLRAAFSRRMMKPTRLPSAAMATSVVAILFPVWFFVQAQIQSHSEGSVAAGLRASAWLMPVCLVAPVLAVLAYWKVHIAATLQLRAASVRHLIAGVLLGLAMWVPAHELFVVQSKILEPPRLLAEANEAMAAALAGMPTWEIVVCLGVVPGLCEELLFRGFLLSGLAGAVRKPTAILAAAGVFAAFHFFLFKVPVTLALGLVLGYVCWQSRSIWPAAVAHALHNSVTALLAANPPLAERLRLDASAGSDHLPTVILVVGFAVSLLGVLLLAKPERGATRTAIDNAGGATTPRES